MIEDPRPEEVSEELLALMQHALHLGLEVIQAHGQPLVPFALMEHNEVRRAEVFGEPTAGAETSLEECFDLMQQRAPLLAFEEDRMAVVYDGYLDDDAGRRDTVFAEGIERGMGTSVTMAQPYAKRRRGRRIRRLGDPVAVEVGRHFIR